MVRGLAQSELRARAARLKLVFSDVDGVQTDAGVYYSERGEELKRFSVRDGMGFELLRRSDIQGGFITRESSGCVARRAEKLKLEHVHLGVWNKREVLPKILAEHDLSPAEVAYIGDDINDLEALHYIGERGLTGAPADAMPAVLEVVHFHAPARGGHGAFRDFAEWILSLRS